MSQLSEAKPSSKSESRVKNVQDNRRLDSENKTGETKSGWLMYLVSSVLIGAGCLVFASYMGVFHRGPTGPVRPTETAIPAQYDSARAYGYLKQLCDFGPRPSGTTAMKNQQVMLEKFFRQRGAEVSFQTFEIRHPENGQNVPMANLIASWHPDRPKRFFVCAHYDTRPFPDQDRFNKKGRFIGANDGASGTAGLMELANQMKDLPADVGVDLIAFDAEEFVWQQGRDDYFLGSTFFAEKYKAQPPKVPYRAGVLLDMIGDRELKIYYEGNSLRYARTVAQQIWSMARKLRVRAFVPRKLHTIQDDHLPLNRIAGIPTVDLIDFDYPRPGFGAPSYWHTEMDVPENCSGESIAAVIWVVHSWLKNQ